MRHVDGLLHVIIRDTTCTPRHSKSIIKRFCVEWRALNDLMSSNSLVTLCFLVLSVPFTFASSSFLYLSGLKLFSLTVPIIAIISAKLLRLWKFILQDVHATILDFPCWIERR